MTRATSSHCLKHIVRFLEPGASRSPENDGRCKNLSRIVTGKCRRLPAFQAIATESQPDRQCNSTSMETTGCITGWIHSVTMPGTNQTALLSRTAARFSASHHCSFFDPAWSTRRRRHLPSFQTQAHRTETETSLETAQDLYEKPNRKEGFSVVRHLALKIPPDESCVVLFMQTPLRARPLSDGHRSPPANSEERKAVMSNGNLCEACRVLSTFCPVAASTPRRYSWPHCSSCMDEVCQELPLLPRAGVASC